MRLADLCEIKFNMSDADFWIYARGTEKSLGMPTTDPDNYEKKIGIKVKEEAKDKLDCVCKIAKIDFSILALL